MSPYVIPFHLHYSDELLVWQRNLNILIDYFVFEDLILYCVNSSISGDCRGHDRMVVGLITTSAISAYNH
jgi:hypothetical protein